MTRISFQDLLLLYRNTNFERGEETDAESTLTVASQDVADLLVRIDSDDDDAADAGITILDDLDHLVIGSEVRIRAGAPRVGLGTLAHDISTLILRPTARIEEPQHYYLVNPRFASGDSPAPEPVTRYRKILSLVDLFGEAASFLDKTKAELIFIKDGKTSVPVNFGPAEIEALNIDHADRLLRQFDDELHREQKLEILFEALIAFCRPQPTVDRFSFTLRNLSDLSDAVRDGFKLFASKFSYSKIRREIEDARIEYTQKIHKTIVDIQNQLLGIPIATFIVASQMKIPTACGVEWWINSVILAGACIFVILLSLALGNQWETLSVIKSEINGQKNRLINDFPGVSRDFSSIFDSLIRRIHFHYAGLIIVGLIALIGVYTASALYEKMNALPVEPCAAEKIGTSQKLQGLPRSIQYSAQAMRTTEQARAEHMPG